MMIGFLSKRYAILVPLIVALVLGGLIGAAVVTGFREPAVQTTHISAPVAVTINGTPGILLNGEVIFPGPFPQATPRP